MALGTRKPISIDSVTKITHDGKTEKFIFELEKTVVIRGIVGISTVSSDGTVQEIHQADQFQIGLG